MVPGIHGALVQSCDRNLLRGCKNHGCRRLFSRILAVGDEESDFNRFQARLKTYCNIILWSIHNMDTNINNDGVLQKSSVYTKGQN